MVKRVVPVNLRAIAIICLTIIFIPLPFVVDSLAGGGFAGATLAFATATIEFLVLSRLTGEFGCGYMVIVSAFATLCCAYAWLMQYA